MNNIYRTERLQQLELVKRQLQCAEETFTEIRNIGRKADAGVVDEQVCTNAIKELKEWIDWSEHQIGELSS